MYGRALRFVLVDMIRRHGTISVAQLVTELHTVGYPVRGRTSKVVSDALRWEVARGRVVRVRRGIYRFGSAPATTARRIKLFATRCRTWIVALMRREPLPPTPPDRRRDPAQGLDLPWFPPWFNTAWLWTM